MGQHHRQYNQRVASVLSEMGVNHRHKVEAEKEEREKIRPVVAKLLSEELGMKLRPDQYITENPLDDAGEEPMAGSTGSNDPVNQQDRQDQQNQQNNQRRSKNPNIRVKDNAGGGTSLDDLSEAMNRVSESMRDMETIMQTLKKRSNEVKEHRNILRPFLKDIDEAIAPFRRLVE